MKTLRLPIALLALLLPSAAALAQKDAAGLAADAELVELRSAVPVLKAGAPYEPADNTIVIELSEYAGYAGLIAANGGMAPSEESYFFKNHKFKVKISIAEEENWSAINAGRIGVSATTVDVLPIYGKQFNVVVPILIGFSRGADGIVVQTDINQINNLKGKTIAACQFNESDFFIRYLAQESGLEVNMLPDLNTPPHQGKVNLVYCIDSFGAGDIFLRDVLAGRKRLQGCATWEPKTSEVVQQSQAKAKTLITNKNLLIIADVLIVNRDFAQKHPEMLKGLVDGVLTGNAMLRADPKPHLDTIAKAFKWTAEKAAKELGKVHLANLPENLAFFAGTIDSSGSYGYIYELAVYAYGPQFIRAAHPADKFLDLSPLKAIDAEGTFKDQKAEIKPIRERPDLESEQPLLARDVRFLFQPNLNKLDLENKQNLADLEHIAKLLQVSPGSTILLRGHTDTSMVASFRKQGGEKLVRQMAMRAIQLSKERCDEVKTILVQNNKIPADRIETVGCGWAEPISDDQPQNRRVEVQWFTVN